MSGLKRITSTVLKLPLEILIDILTRLPSKSLLQLRCVSKLFCLLIGDDSFADLHYRRSLTLCHGMSILISFVTKARQTRVYYTINFTDETRGTLKANRVRYFDECPKSHLGTYAKGLISLLTNSGDDVICNPSTRQQISLPRICVNNSLLESNCERLAFDPVLKKYKLLKSVWYSESGNRIVNGIAITHSWMRQWVFTLGVDQSWREIECIQFYHANCCFHHFFHSVQIDRIIYSFNWKFGSSRPANIAAFDVCAESTHIISFPNDFSSQCSHRMSSGLIMRSALVDLDGRLAILHISKVDDRKYSMVIWKMEKCMVWEQLAIAIPLEASQMIHRCLLRVTTNHFGEVMLFLIGRSKTIFVLVLLYNFKSQVWRKLDIHGLLDKPSPCFWDTAVMHVIVDNLFSVAGGSSNRPLAYAG